LMRLSGLKGCHFTKTEVDVIPTNQSRLHNQSRLDLDRI
jgi:hypothetical protein